ncbi:MAG: SUMF1/EgtB/PvdO family nonheme iron enzyme [Opitutae bacterium]|nr:SUMF1/EgtB/PvdO family nonheme iron enzyme [Opitutae bacterium]
MKAFRLVAGLLLLAATVSSVAASPPPTRDELLDRLAAYSDGEIAEAIAALTELTTDASGNVIPHPADTTTYAVVDGTTTVQVPTNMIYVPAGSFTYGNGSSAASVTLDAFCIGRYEVTNAEWKAYLDANSLKTYPAHWSAGTYPAGKANHPVLYVSLNSALAYCAWVSAQTGWSITVPTAYQWEKAARGPSGNLYPWSNTLDASYNSSTGALITKFNYNGVTAAYYLYNSPTLAVSYTNAASSYYGQSTTVSRIAAYDTSGSATYFSINSSGSVSGWVNHDTYTGFIYTSLFDTIMSTGGNTSAVGAYPASKSAYGCHDMAGNVFEWTTTVSTASNGAEAGQSVNQVRGGSWYANGTSGRSIDIGEGRSASGAFNTVGFRVVRNFSTAVASDTTTGAAGTTATSGTSSGTSTTTTTTTTGTSTTGSSSASGGGGGPTPWAALAFAAAIAGRALAQRRR